LLKYFRLLSLKSVGIVLYCYSSLCFSFTEPFSWPNEAKAAVSLSYDDSLNSQLDHAIPALDKYGFKASFYLSLSSTNVVNRLTEWRNIANNKHELGNHTLNHHCRGSLLNREWVSAENDLDKRTLKSVLTEVKNANNFLTAIDGHTTRTFTAPCGDNIVEKQDYLQKIEPYFIGIKSHVGAVPATMPDYNRLRTPVYAPNNATGEELISYVQSAAQAGTIANITFHGIGGDYLSVSNEAHHELLAYLDKHRAIYWVETFKNISAYVLKHKENNGK